MTLPRTIAAVLLAGALSIAGLSALTMAVGAEGALGHQAWAGDSKHQAMCKRGGKGKSHHDRYGHGKRGHHKWGHDPKKLAARLSALETEIGIRAEQLDVWRDYTDALQAMLKRPSRGAWMTAGSDEPFSRVDAMADRVIERAEAAEKVKAAIAELKTTLTPEQLEKVTEIGKRFQARMAKHHGWKGPRGAGPRDAAPAGRSPAPDKGPDDDTGQDAETSDGDDT